MEDKGLREMAVRLVKEGKVDERGLRCKMMWGRLDRDVAGRTTWFGWGVEVVLNDKLQGAPTVAIKALLRHELAHVTVGRQKGHGEEWKKARNADWRYWVGIAWIDLFGPMFAKFK